MGGKSSKQTIGYWYDMDVLATFANEIHEVIEIRVGDRTAWLGLITESGTRSIYKDELFGGEKREGGVYGQVDFMFGESDLPVNEFLGSSMRKTGITGPVPAYRSTFNLFFRGVDTVNAEFDDSGVFTKEASPPPLVSNSLGFELKPKVPSRAFRWSALNPYFKPFKIKARRYTKDWHPEIVKIFSEGKTDFRPLKNIDQLATYAYSDPSPSIFVSETISIGKRTVRVTFNPFGKYLAWSPWGTDDGHPNPWVNQFSVKIDGGPLQTFWSTNFPTMEQAAEYALANPIVFDVDDYFQIGLSDAPFDDNRGGLSITIEVTDFVVDMNPAHIIRECLTNVEWGMGYPTADIDDARFYAVAQTLYDEDFGISLRWTQQSTIEDFIMLVLRHINGVVTQDRSTGKLFIKLIRDDYSVGSLTVLDQTNSTLVSYSRATGDEIVNEVTLKYTNANGASDAITVHDLAGLFDGQIKSQEVDLPGIRNPQLAARVAQRELESRIKPIAKLTITTDRRAFNLYEGDVFKFTWIDHGISNMVCRILSMDMGSLEDNKITIEAVQDVFGLPNTSYVKPAYSDWVNPITPLTASPYRYITETPYYDIARTMSTADLAYLEATDCYIDVFAKEASSDALGYNLWTAAGSANVEMRTTAPYAAVTLLTVALVREETSILNVEDAGSIAYLIESENACVIVNGEYMQITDYDVGANTITVNRGVLDTVPMEHVIGSSVILTDASAGQDEISYIPTEIVKVKAQTHSSSGDLSIIGTPEDTYTVNQRQARPYPPGQVRVNTIAYPDTIGLGSGLSLTWKHRNRLTQTASIIDQATGTITPEVGTEYELRIYGDTDSLLRTETITGESFNYTTTLETADGGGVVINPTVIIDPWWDKMKLLLNFNGANASTTFVDSSPNFTTVIGNTQISTTQSKFGGASGLFDGTGDYLEYKYLPDFNIGSGDFCIEFWMRPGSVSVGQVMFDWRDANAAKGIVITQPIAAPSKVFFGVGDSNTTAFEVSITSSASLSVGTWYHIAAVKNGTVFTLYINGASEGTATNAVVPYINASNIRIGAARDASSGYNGYIDDLRVTKAVRYPSAFTVPSSELGKYTKGANFSDNKLLLTFDGANGATTTTDVSDLALSVSFFGNAKIGTAQSKFGGSSLELDGTFATFAEVAFNVNHSGSGANITIECFAYANSVSSSGTIISRETSSLSGGRSGWMIGMDGTGKLFAQGWDNAGATAFTIVAVASISVSTWYHVALVRNGTTWTLYQNAVSIGTATESAVLGVGGQPLRVGDSAWTSIKWNGYIDEVRIRALAATITVPTVSNYAIDSEWSNVILLSNFNDSNGSVEIENVAELTKTLTVVGNAQISTAQSKFGGASGYFDGTGDYLTYPHSSDYSANSGDFTVEAWIRPATLSTIRVIASKRPAGGATSTEWEFYTNASGQIAMVAWNSSGGVVANVVGTTVLTVDTWYHVAMCRQGSTWRLFVDGVLDSSGAQSGTVGANTALLYIGYDASTAGAGRDWNGYIDDLRITRGARYTESFTPITGQLSKMTSGIDPEWDNVCLLLNNNGADLSTTVTDSSSFNRVVTVVGNAKLSTGQSRFGSASLSLDGTGDYVTVPNSIDFSASRGDLTIECWIRPANVSSLRTIATKRPSSGTVTEWALVTSATGKLGVTAWNSSGTVIVNMATTTSLIIDTWAHVALTRKDTTWYLFINGVMEVSAVETGIAGTNSSVMYIGTDPSTAGRDFNGYIDDFRFTKNYARYTDDFAIPTAELSMVAYTSSSLNTQLRFELEAKRDGLTSWTMHNHTVTRA